MGGFRASGVQGLRRACRNHGESKGREKKHQTKRVFVARFCRDILDIMFPIVFSRFLV